MYLMYVDESGDTGIMSSPTRYFILTGIIVHELRWNEYLDRLIIFRRRMRSAFGLLLRDEIHAAHFINKPSGLARIRRNDRLSILRFLANELSAMTDLSIVNIVVDKEGKPPDYDVLDHAWVALIQRFSNTMSHKNFPGPANPDDRGLVLPDMSEVKKITATLRRMRRYNPVPNQGAYGGGYRNITISTMVEDPCFKDSRDSYFIQAADLAAFLLYQKFAPSTYIRSKGAQNYFSRLRPVLCTVASTTDPDGIVRL